MEQPSGIRQSGSKQPWVRYELVLGRVGGSRKKYAEFVTDGIERGYDTPWNNVSGQVVLGQEKFVERIKGGLANGEPSANSRR